MNKTIKNREKFLTYIMKKFPFEETRAAGVYFDKELKTVMTVTGNEVSFTFQKGSNAKVGKRRKRLVRLFDILAKIDRELNKVEQVDQYGDVVQNFEDIDGTRVTTRLKEMIKKDLKT